MSRLRVNKLTNKNNDGAPEFIHGASVTGVVTATAFKGDGSELTGVSADTNILNSGVPSGSATSLNFGNNISVDSVANGVASLSVSVPPGLSVKENGQTPIDAVSSLSFDPTGFTVTNSASGEAFVQNSAGVGINSTGTSIATNVNTLNFVGAGNTFAYDSANNTVNISIAGASSGGGGAFAEEIITNLTQIDSKSFTKFPISQYEGSGIAQLSDTQLMYGSFGYSSSNVRCYGQAFQVDSSGNIVMGSQTYAQNSSGTSVSTTVFGEPHPGDLAWMSRCYWSNSYVIMSFGVTVNSNNTVSAGRYVGNDYNSSGYAHPQSGNVFGTKSGSTKYAWYGGYGFGSSYSGYVRWSYNGSSHYNHSSGSNTSSVSSTTASHPALQHHSNTAAPVGMMFHRDGNTSPNLYYGREYYGSSYSNLGWSNSLTGSDLYNNFTGFRLDDGKAVYIYSNGNNAFVTNGSGSTLKSQASISGWGALNANESYVNRSTIALGNDYFAIPSDDLWNIVKITLDGSYNINVNTVASVFVGVISSLPSHNNNHIGWRLAGPNQEYLVVSQNGSIITYDATPLTSLMV